MIVQFNGIHLLICAAVSIAAFAAGAFFGYVLRDEKDDFVDIDMAEDAE